MRWCATWRADPLANRLAKRHYTCQSPESAQFVPPGRCLVLVTPDADAVWVTSWPFAAYVKHAWAGAWVCSIFRNEGPHLSSELIREAVAATRWAWPDVPPLGMVTFVDAGKVRRKRDPGRCFLRAGFKPPACPDPLHFVPMANCDACQGRTKGGLLAFQLLPAEMPDALAPLGAQLPLGAA